MLSPHSRDLDVADLFCNIELVRNWSVAFREDLEELLGPKLDGEFGERFEEMVATDLAIVH